MSKSHGSHVQSILNIAAVAWLGFAPIILDDHRRPRPREETLRESQNGRGTTCWISVLGFDSECFGRATRIKFPEFNISKKMEKQAQEARTPRTSIPGRVSRLPLALAGVN